MPNVLENDEKRPAAFLSPAPHQRPNSVENATFSVNEPRPKSPDRQPAQNDARGLHDVSSAPGASSVARSPIDIDEDYEPPRIPESIQTSDPGHSTGSTKQNDRVQEAGTPHAIHSPTTHFPLQSLELDIIDNDPRDTGPHESGSGSNRSLPNADPNDSDDYEPPEPAFTVEPLTPDAVIDETKSFIPSPLSELKPLSKAGCLRPTLPVRNDFAMESSNPDEEVVRFLSIYLIMLTFLLGCQKASQFRTDFVRALRKSTKEVQIVSISSRIPP